MEVIKEWVSNPILFALALLVLYAGKKLFDSLFDFLIKKTKTEYISKQEFDEYIKENKLERETLCKAKMDACGAHRHESLSWLEPFTKKIIKQNVEIKKILHLIGTKQGLDETILASLINGDMSE